MEAERALLDQKYPWLKELKPLASGLVAQLYEKEAQYAGSWQRRGGVGAYMMTCRKTDRIEEISKRNGYDIFKALVDNDAGVEDDVKDLVTYYMLILSETKRQREEQLSLPLDRS